MAKTDNLYSTKIEVGSFDSGYKYATCPLSTLEAALNNSKYVPANATVTKVQLYANISWWCGGGASAKGYVKYGFGGTQSVNKELLTSTRIEGGASADNAYDYPSGGVDVTSYLNNKVAPNVKFKTDNGSNLVFAFQSDNWAKKTYHVKSVTLEITYHSHSYTSTVTTQPTCETAGVRTYTCSCGNSSYTESIPALGHSYIDIVTPPTCTSQGYTTHNCGGCSHSYVDTYVAAKGHSWVNATCNTPKTCSVCGATEGSALGHSYTSAITKQPTCTEKGIKTFTCQHDSSHKYTEEVAPLGHDYVKTEVAPTTTTDGYDNYVCSRCGDSYQNNYTCLYTVKCNSEGGTVSGGGTHSKGTNVTISATPNEGWYVAGWKLNGIELTHLAGVNSFNETVDKSKEYEVVFAKIPPKFTSVQMLYQNQQISETNKVLANQFFRIVVGVE